MRRPLLWVSATERAASTVASELLILQRSSGFLFPNTIPKMRQLTAQSLASWGGNLFPSTAQATEGASDASACRKICRLRTWARDDLKTAIECAISLCRQQPARPYVASLQTGPCLSGQSPGQTSTHKHVDIDMNEDNFRYRK